MENVVFWFEIIVAMLTGLVACIPLVIKLVQVVKDTVKAKNWTPLMQLVLKLMAEAEENYSTGAEREEYVIDTIKAMESTLNYDVDEAVIREMIAAIVKASKKINVK